MMLPVHVAFNYRGQEWSHDFQVPTGAPVLKLKEQMVAPDGAKADVDSFELRRHGNRVPDFEPITQESTFEFGFLGPEEGAKRAAGDAAAKEATHRAWEEERRRQEWRRQQQHQSEAARAKEREAEEEAPKPVVEVQVTVRHAMEDKESEVKVKVMSNCTILDVRNAVLAAIGETKLSEVKLVKRFGGALTTLKNEAEIGERREFLSMGRKLLPVGGAGDPTAEGQKESQQQAEASQAPPSGDVWLKVTSKEDRAHRTIQMAGTRTMRELKAQLCEEVKRSFVGKVKLSIGDWSPKDSDKLQIIPQEHWESMMVEGIELGPPKEVQVKVMHCNTQHSVSVAVLDTINIKELRKAVSDETTGDLSEVKIVRRLMGGSNGGWSSISDSERLNGRNEFFCMGKALEQPPPGQQPAKALPAPVFEDREISISVCLDRELGIAQEVPVKLGSSIRSLKELLAASDPTHRTRPEDIGLELSASPGRPLADYVCLTEEYSKLDLVQGGGQDDAAAEAASQDEPTGFVWTEQGVGIVQGEMAQRCGWPKVGDPFMASQLAAIRKEPQWSWVDSDYLASQGVIKAAGPFELTLTHALDGTSTTVQVSPTASILEVRRAVMLAIGQTKLSEVKLLDKAADGDFLPLEDGDTLEHRTHLFTVGCSLA